MHVEQTDLESRAEVIAERLRKRGKWVSPDLRVRAEIAADMLGIAEGTLSNWRAEGRQRFPCVRPAGFVTYYLVDLLQYIDCTTD